MEEDCTSLAADCAALSCCCPCLLLQLGVFVLLRLPQRLAAKSKKLVMGRKIKVLFGPASSVSHSTTITHTAGAQLSFPNRTKNYFRQLSHSLATAQPGQTEPKIRGRKLGTNELRKMEEFGEEEIEVDGGGGAHVVTALGDEEVWEVLLSHGVFWFGSFWGEGGKLMENYEGIQLGKLQAIGAIVGWGQSLEKEDH